MVDKVSLYGDCSRNIAAKADKMSDAQASFVTSERTGQKASSEHESLDDDDVERNADLYIFYHEVTER